nr:precorrin-6y C5,15-methyltransferase (decarboxylating) subunit CbiE [Sedimentibacter sp.]
MKKLYIVGIGPGGKKYIHSMAKEAIEESECLIGARRMLEVFDHLKKEMYESISTPDIIEQIKNSGCSVFSLLVSGDSGFYSLSKKITENLLEDHEITVENIPSISSMQYLCSKLNISWDDVKHISAHGRDINIAAAVMFSKKTFFLTGGEFGPQEICKVLCGKGLGHLKVTAGENLSYSNEKITTDTAINMAEMHFDSLCAMLVQNDDAVHMDEGLRSIGDDEFITGNIPMTKSEVRTISIGKLNIKNSSTVYDIGAGTGSVSIETALKLNYGRLYAIEKNEEAISLIEKNKEKFKTYNIDIIKGQAPECLENLPSPDCVFIGGSGGNLVQIIETVLRKNQSANVVINAIALESVNEALKCMEKFNLEDVEITNVWISKSKKVRSYNMMMGQNPIYIISGKGSGLN